MEQVTISILTLLALYALYSECIKLPAIVKQNKKLCYALVIGMYFYYHQNNVVEGFDFETFADKHPFIFWPIFSLVCLLVGLVAGK